MSRVRVIGGLVGLILLIPLGMGFALDVPHTAPESVGCGSCHVSHNSLGSNLTNQLTNPTLCKSCHTPAGTASSLPFADSNQAKPGISGTSHSWSGLMPAMSNPSNAYGLRATADLTNGAVKARVTGSGNAVICSACHDEHSQLYSAWDPFAVATSRGESGTATGGTVSTLTDTSKVWTINQWANAYVKIMSGANSGLERRVVSNTATELTFGASFPSAVGASDTYYLNSGRHFMRTANSLNELCVDCHYYRNQTDVTTYTGSPLSHPIDKTLSRTKDPSQYFDMPREPQSAGFAAQTGARGELNGGTDANLKNNIVLASDLSILCLSCHDTHYSQTSDGNLLRRPTEETCHACHKTDTNTMNDTNSIKTHNSTTTSSTKWSSNWGKAGGQYGAIVCTTCHAPHRSRNIFLVKESVSAASGSFPGNTVDLRYLSGTAGSAPYAPGDDTGGHAASTRVCEVCHSQNRYHNYNTANNTGGVGHNDGSNCLACHSHKNGFQWTESGGGSVNPEFTKCSACHPNTWAGMNSDSTKVSKHTLGNVVGTNDYSADTNVSWAVDNFAAANPASVRSCANMCHQDHRHNPVGAPGTSHANNVHQDSGDQSTRSVTRNSNGDITAAATTGSPAKTDFDNTAAYGGMCLSCHRGNADAARPAISIANYNTSAHNYTSDATGVTANWSFTIHDGSVFNRNCTKCHADSFSYGISGSPLKAVHYSDNQFMLAESSSCTAGSTTNFVCYGCHGNAANRNSSDKDLQTVFAKTRVHPVQTTDDHHVSFGSAGEEPPGTGSNFQSGSFIGANRHVSCEDCHSVHEAGKTKHTIGAAATITNTSPLYGVWGVSAPPKANWADYTVSTDFTKMTPVTAEYQICLKCHSKWAGATLPNSPSGGFAETNLAQEFNVNNASYHWVEYDQTATVAPPGGVYGPAGRANNTPRSLDMLATTSWRTGWSRNSKMYCSDCHGNDSATQTQGPHGSANNFMLKSIVIGTTTYKRWDSTVGYSTSGATSGSNAIFCLGCHNIGGTSGFSQSGGSSNLHTSQHNGRPCQNCHIAVPHGWQRYRLLYISTDPTPYRSTTGGLTAVPTWKTSGNWSENDCHSGGVGSCG